MMRTLCLLVIVLTTTEVSAQQVSPRPQSTTTRTTIYLDPSAPVAKETISYPYTELSEVRLWAPSKKTGEYRWWQLYREHRGPIWERSGSEWKLNEDLVIERWVPGNAPPQLTAEERQPVIRHSTKCYWPEEETKKTELEPRPKRLVEPVFRMRKPQEEDKEEGNQWRPREVKPPVEFRMPPPELKAAPKQEEDEPAGPTFLVNRSPDRK